MLITSYFPKKLGERTHFGQLPGSSASYLTANIVNAHNGLVMLVTKDMQQALHYQAELRQFSQKEITVLSDWETLPYDQFSPHNDTIASRLVCLSQLPNRKEGIFILPATSLMQLVCPYSFITSHVFIMQTGDKLAREQLRRQLEHAGYRHVHQVMQQGEFATRGALFDLFPVGSHLPYRIDFLDDEIDSIRTFDPDTQLTIEQVTQIRLLPAREFPTHAEAIDLFRSQWRERFGVSRGEESLYQQVSAGQLPAGIEYWQSLFFKEPLSTLFDYLPKETLIVTEDGLLDSVKQFWQDILRRYESLRHDVQRPILAPEALWLHEEVLFKHIKDYLTINLSMQPVKDGAHYYNLNYAALPDLHIHPQHKLPLQALQTFIAGFNGKTVFSCESE